MTSSNEGGATHTGTAEPDINRPPVFGAKTKSAYLGIDKRRDISGSGEMKGHRPQELAPKPNLHSSESAYVAAPRRNQQTPRTGDWV